MGITSVLAYIDAGSGSMILQAAATGIFAFIIFSRQIIDRVHTVFRRNADQKKTTRP